MFWIKNTDGKKDAVLTFALLSVVTVLMKLIFSGVTFSFSHFNWTLSSIDSASIGAILLPTLGAYVSNKYVKLNYHPEYKDKKE